MSEDEDEDKPEAPKVIDHTASKTSERDRSRTS
jgi:hypothetical protein